MASQDPDDVSTCNHAPAYGRLMPERHAFPDLIEFVLSNIELLSEYHTKEYYDQFRDQSMPDLIRDMSVVFDRMFFAGNLAGYFELKFEGKHHESTNRGITRGHRTREHFYELTLYDSQHFIYEEHTRPLVKRLFGSLLHEMVHVFLLCFGCTNCQDQRSKEDLGMTGHGKAWQTIAWLVQHTVEDDAYIGQEVDLGIPQSTILERGAEFPDDHYLYLTFG